MPLSQRPARPLQIHEDCRRSGPVLGRHLSRALKLDTFRREEGLQQQREQCRNYEDARGPFLPVNAEARRMVRRRSEDCSHLNLPGLKPARSAMRLDYHRDPVFLGGQAAAADGWAAETGKRPLVPAVWGGATNVVSEAAEERAARRESRHRLVALSHRPGNRHEDANDRQASGLFSTVMRLFMPAAGPGMAGPHNRDLPRPLS